MSQGVLPRCKHCRTDLGLVPLPLRLRRQCKLLALSDDQALRHFVQLLLLGRQLCVVGSDSSLHLLQERPCATRHVPYQRQLLV